MVVILVVLTFVAFALIDLALKRGRQTNSVAIAAHTPAVVPAEPSVAYVDGFAVPDRMRYHPGHTWALTERKQVQRVGIDEFAACLAGTIEKIELPKPGQWIRQGQKAWAVDHAGHVPRWSRRWKAKSCRSTKK